MGENSSIQWTHHTFNPWVGCTKVSPGCTNCYAETYDQRFGGGHWGPRAPRRRTAAANWKKPLAWNRDAEKAGTRARVFCASLADVFDPEVPSSWRGDLYALIEQTPHLDWLLLTKRPERLNDMAVPAGWPSNVWLGVTVENQEQAVKRIPLLCAQQATVRFLSCEPLLGPLDLSRWLDEDRAGFVGYIDWLIIGGESGPKARPFDVAWARSLIAQCRDGGHCEAAPFVKQLGRLPVEGAATSCAECGHHVPIDSDGCCGSCGLDAAIHPERVLRLRDSHGGDPSEWPEDLRVREFPCLPWTALGA